MISMSWIILLLTFILMEAAAWSLHKYVMHGFLWSWHEDHHVRRPGFFEKNDRFFLVFAVPSSLSIFFGSLLGISWLMFIGFGIALYGAAYSLVHDIFIHQRIKIFTRSNNIYLRAIRKAHKVHHKHLGKEDGECFGMLLVPIKYFKEAAASGK